MYFFIYLQIPMQCNSCIHHFCLLTSVYMSFFKIFKLNIKSWTPSLIKKKNWFSCLDTKSLNKEKRAWLDLPKSLNETLQWKFYPLIIFLKANWATVPIYKVIFLTHFLPIITWITSLFVTHGHKIMISQKLLPIFNLQFFLTVMYRYPVQTMDALLHVDTMSCLPDSHHLISRDPFIVCNQPSYAYMG